ncbi:GntR family transcriptional regulator [Streptomyces ipomoeae]|uniref:GntR family transcriptional regulator n=1 Tax=Streptomyces ipomoeae TaxID=103232 RepID=UPI001146432D|nr:GntR family transcriptional regulator [Streptomyces ipomoeae]MDX2939170.1 GntR family transcriptional regulator [Streptomyces ipomoeae]TQE31842.1 GntR family transcriptional regulator [Streptomyces ipomoeae]
MSTPSTPVGIDVTGAIRDALLRGEYVPRQRLVETDLCEQFGVGRAGVRAAFQQLVAEGLVEIQRNRGARVREITFAEAVQITEARMVLEGLIAARAAERISPAGGETLRGIGADMAKAVADGELTAYSDLNARLHRCVRDIAGHETANRLIEQLRAQVVRHRFMLSRVPGRARASLPQHQRIIEAIAAGDPGQAEVAMRDHVASVVEALRALETSRTAEG